MQKPSPGRVVFYQFGGKQCLGHVTKTWSDTCINIAAFHEDGSYIGGRISIIHGEPGAEGGWWWPPRVDQAAEVAKVAEAADVAGRITASAAGRIVASSGSSSGGSKA